VKTKRIFEQLSWRVASSTVEAYAVGFDDPGYLEKVFRRHCGVTPLQFRQGAQEFPI
jgi:AraC-like DNA-binding protein